MAVQGLDAAFAAIIKDCQAIAVEAVKNAAKKTQNDIIKEAESCLQKYYANYSPKMYKRTHRLKRAIIPYWADKSGKNGISIEVGVQYKSGALKGAYRSNSRFHQSGDVWKSVTSTDGYSLDIPTPEKIGKLGSDNGIPEPHWVLENYLEGIHPWAQTDDQSTNTLMTKFFDDELPNRISQYVEDSLFDAIIGRL
jgi:hypothetical protein